MAEPTTAPAPIKLTPATHTTRRGFATASFCLALWGTLTFWWYPFGITIASLGVLFGVISIVMGYRAGKDGTHLAWYSVFLGGFGASLAVFAYRFAQMAFEGTPPPFPLPL
jgi:hypothetical protein